MSLSYTLLTPCYCLLLIDANQCEPMPLGLYNTLHKALFIHLVLFKYLVQFIELYPISLYEISILAPVHHLPFQIKKSGRMPLSTISIKTCMTL